MNNGRPESQQRFGGGGPDAAEHGDELRAPGGIVVVTAIATETGGDGGVDDTVFCNWIFTFSIIKTETKKKQNKNKTTKKRIEFIQCWKFI